jgi:hypothetical protein
MGGVVLTATALAVGIEACGGSGDRPETPADVLARGGSIARVTVAARVFDFEVTCYDVGAGSIIAVGTGTEVDTTEGVERATRLFVQAFLGDSYIGVTVETPRADGADGDGAEEEVFEAALDESFDLYLEDDVIAAEGIAFVRNLDLTRGEGEPAGEGSVRVTCGGYDSEVPAGLER